MRSRGFSSRTQGLFFYFAGAASWGVLFLGLQYLFIPKSRTFGNNAWLVGCLIVAIVLWTTYRVLSRRTKREEQRQ